MTGIYWHPVLAARALKSAPVRVLLHDVPLVLFRSGNAIHCLKDICPHRFAPLSQGRVVGGAIECPYHGWQFDGTGRCTKIPLHDGEPPQRFVSAYAAQERHGLIFVTQDAGKAEPLHEPSWDHQPFVRSVMHVECESLLADAVENVLDPIHTLFVHRGLLRGEGSRKSPLEIRAAVRNRVLEIDFTGEEGQDGLLSRLLEGERTRSCSTFRMPGVVELMYHGRGKLNLVTTLYFTRCEGQRYKGFALMTGPNCFGSGYLKALLFVPIMKKVIAQDRRIMGASYANWKAFGEPLPARSPLDVFRPGIEAVIDGIDTLPEQRLILEI